MKRCTLFLQVQIYDLDFHFLPIYNFFSVHEFIRVPIEHLNTVFYSLRKQENPLRLRRNVSEIKIGSYETYGKNDDIWSRLNRADFEWHSLGLHFQFL